MSGTAIGLIGFGCLLAMLAIRVHITMAMFITGASIYLVMNHGESSGLLYTLNNLVYARVSNYDLAVIPLFILMVVMVLLMYYVPGITSWLPEHMQG